MHCVCERLCLANNYTPIRVIIDSDWFDSGLTVSFCFFILSCPNLFRMNVLQRVVTGTARFVVKPGVNSMGTRCAFTGQFKRLFQRMSFNPNRSRCSVGPADGRPEVSLNRLEGEDNGRCK